MKIELYSEKDYPITVEIEGTKFSLSGNLSFSQDVFGKCSASLKLSRGTPKDVQKDEDFFKIGGTAVD